MWPSKPGNGDWLRSAAEVPVPVSRAGRARNGDWHLEDLEPVPTPRPTRIVSYFAGSGESGSSMTSTFRIQTWLPGSCCWKAKWPCVKLFFLST